MKNLSILFVVFLFLQVTTPAQQGWFEQTSGTTEDLISVYIINKDTGWVVGEDGALIKTINGGNSWIAQSTNLSSINKILFIDSHNGFLAGSSSLAGKLLKTTDGGITWIEKQTLMEDFDFPSDIFFINQNIGWLILRADEMSSGPYMQKTTDGGETWFEILNCPGGSFESIYFTDENKGWLATIPVGFGVGSLHNTTDGGESWAEQLTGEFFSIHFVDSQNGWTVGSYLGSLPWAYRTTNGGDDWIEMNTQLDEIHSVFFTDVENGWIVGWADKLPPDYFIQGTNNGGVSWFEQYSSAKHLKSIYFINDTTGWAVGDSGLILHTNSGGVSYVEEEEIDETPITYYLSNNFPNPFNPSTKINYSIPQSSNVVIKVFDILGNDIETLVNEEKAVGTYELTWYAENLPSGVYFYQLKAGSFIETKKMVFMK